MNAVDPTQVYKSRYGDIYATGLPNFNRAERRVILKDAARKPDLHARFKCSGASKPLPEETNEYMKLQAARKVAARRRLEKAAKRHHV